MSLAKRTFARFYNPPHVLKFMNNEYEFTGTVTYKRNGEESACYGYWDGASYKVYVIYRGQIQNVGRVNGEDLVLPEGHGE